MIFSARQAVTALAPERYTARRAALRIVATHLAGFAAGAIALLSVPLLPAHGPAAMLLIDRAPHAVVGHEGRAVQREEDGLFYVRAAINGHPVRFLVDTGATAITLTAEDAVAAGVMPSHGRFNASLATAGGQTAMAWTTIRETRVAGRRIAGVRAAVVADGLPVSLLGQDMLSRIGPMRIEGDLLRIG